MPNMILDLWEAWKFMTGSLKSRALWRAAFLAVIWIIWKERNLCCFEGKCLNIEVLLDKIKFTVASWGSILPQFKGIPINLILLDWKVVAWRHNPFGFFFLITLWVIIIIIIIFFCGVMLFEILLFWCPLLYALVGGVV